jgi:hypothetical protein
MTVRSVRALGLALFSLSAGCGGSEKPAASAASADVGAESAETEAESTDAESDEASTADAPAAKANCDDGTCSPCGDALCPSGWYCDESAPGGAACGWLPECAKKPACACVKKAFAGCSCEDTGGIAHLSCG